MIYLIIALLVVILICGVFYYRLKRLQKHINDYNKTEEDLKKLSEIFEKKSCANKELTDKFLELKLICVGIEEERKHLLERMALTERIEKEKLEEKLLKEKDKLEIKIVQINETIKEYDDEITILLQQQAAINEAIKQQEIIKSQQDFYKINISKESLMDINFLLEIAPKLNQKELLYKLIWTTYYKPSFDKMVNQVIGSSTYSGIYKITSLIDGRAYIGQSTNVKNRWTEHVKSALEIGSIAKNQLYSAMKELGVENFTFELLEECEKSKLNEREKFYIKFFQTYEFGYNMTKGNSG